MQPLPKRVKEKWNMCHIHKQVQVQLAHLRRLFTQIRLHRLHSFNLNSRFDRRYTSPRSKFHSLQDHYIVVGGNKQDCFERATEFWINLTLTIWAHSHVWFDICVRIFTHSTHLFLHEKCIDKICPTNIRPTVEYHRIIAACFALHARIIPKQMQE